VYRALRAEPAGPVLEVPPFIPDLSGRNDYLQAQAMYASLYHEHALLNLHTHYQPEASLLVARTALGLPSTQALQAVVDMTHLRWIVVHHAQAHPRWLRGAQQGLQLAGRFGDDLLFAVTLPPKRPWVNWLSEGARPGRTLLGTPLESLPMLRGTLEAQMPVDAIRPGVSFPVRLRIRNLNKRDWPVSVPIVPRGALDNYVVAVEARFDGPAVHVVRVPLPYDVTAGDEIVVSTTILAPPAEGPYSLTWNLVQGDQTRAVAKGTLVVTP
jgi:hypothetical protein